MRIHDRYARVTPYEMALPGRAFAEERFELIREEADRRGVDVWDPGAFSMLEEARRAIADIRVEDDDPVLFVQYGVILFHAFHFWSAGEHLYLLGNEAAHQVTHGPRSAPEDWAFAAPSRAGYVQLPHYLFWARPEAGGPAEALDGFLWALTPARRLHLMVASGMRADRPGLGVMPVPEIPGEEASRWGRHERARAGRRLREYLAGRRGPVLDRNARGGGEARGAGLLAVGAGNAARPSTREGW